MTCDNNPNAEPAGGEVKLKAKMSLLNGITVIVGSIIGSGIFVSPTGVLLYTGSVNSALIVWLASGLFSMVGAYCYAELGCMISKTGADYAYIMETFGPFLAFIRLWTECMIVRPCSQAIVALTFSVYVLKPVFPDCVPPDPAVRLLAAMCIMLLTFVNCWDVGWATKVQDYFTFAKLLALFIIILAGIFQLTKGQTQYFTFDNSKTEVTSLALSFYSGLFAYNGWNYLNFIIEELKDPTKNLPRAIAISCSLCTLVYVMANVAFYTTLSPREVLESEAVAVTFANKLFGSVAWTIPVFVAMSTFGAVNGILLTSSRLFYAGACEGQMPEILTMIQINRMTPAPAVLCIALLSLAYLLVSDILALINYVGFATWAIEHWCRSSVPTLASVEATKLAQTDQSPSYISCAVYTLYNLRYYSSNYGQASRDRNRLSYDSHQHSGVSHFYQMEKQTTILYRCCWKSYTNLAKSNHVCGTNE
ncbi:Y+L amino acid transporter 2 isoform X6 [Halyomorpha halys]|uniref:Y+L amino acid transporter 2 isoform X6 n=1 Tax=Halyomorpha halys TaxID=286706 RepID=UPI0006D4EE96